MKLNHRWHCSPSTKVEQVTKTPNLTSRSITSDKKYSTFGNLWVWTHHHQETIWYKFEHNQKCWMNETFIASISALFDIFSKIQVSTFYRVKMQYARRPHVERLVKLHRLAQWIKRLKLSDRRIFFNQGNHDAY